MRLVEVDYKTIDRDLLRRNGWALDAGCYGFNFAWQLTKWGLNVVALDPAPEIKTPVNERIYFERIALLAHDVNEIEYVRQANPHANFTRPPTGGYTVPATTIPALMAKYKVPLWEIVKLNIEGGEYAILDTWPGPIARQITVSFHDFLGRNPCERPEDYYGPMLGRLMRWYDVVQHEWTCRGGTEYTYWDSLFVLRQP